MGEAVVVRMMDEIPATTTSGEKPEKCILRVVYVVL